MIKEEDLDVQIKEEKLEIEHEATFFSEIEGKQVKRSLSPSLRENIPGSKRPLPDVKGSLTENEQTMECCECLKS